MKALDPGLSAWAAGYTRQRILQIACDATDIGLNLAAEVGVAGRVLHADGTPASLVLLRSVKPEKTDFFEWTPP